MHWAVYNLYQVFLYRCPFILFLIFLRDLNFLLERRKINFIKTLHCKEVSGSFIVRMLTGGWKTKLTGLYIHYTANMYKVPLYGYPFVLILIFQRYPDILLQIWKVNLFFILRLFLTLLLIECYRSAEKPDEPGCIYLTPLIYIRSLFRNVPLYCFWFPSDLGFLLNIRKLILLSLYSIRIFLTLLLFEC